MLYSSEIFYHRFVDSTSVLVSYCNFCQLVLEGLNEQIVFPALVLLGSLSMGKFCAFT